MSSPDPERIWLEPACAAPDRSWCTDDAWGKCEECGLPAVEYVRADIVAAERDALTRQVKERDLTIQFHQHRAQIAEAALTRAREALERIAGSRLHDMDTLHPDGCARVAAEALRAL